MAACMRPFAAASFSTLHSCIGCPRAKLATSALTCMPSEALEIRNIGQAGGRYSLTPTECLLLALYPAGMPSRSPPVWTGSSETSACSSALATRGACAPSFLCELQLAPMVDQLYMPVHLEAYETLCLEISISIHIVSTIDVLRRIRQQCLCSAL